MFSALNDLRGVNKMKFYWIDSYLNYDTSFVGSVLNVFRDFYAPIARSRGIDFSFIEATEIDVRVGRRVELVYRGRNILDGKFCAIVQYSNISSKIEKHIETIYRTMRLEDRLFNSSPEIDFVDRDKMFALNLASSLGIPTIPAMLISKKKNYKSFLEEIAGFLGKPPYILKPKEMLSGLGIMKIDSVPQLNSALDIVMTSSKDFIVQKFIQAPSDYRVYIIDGKPKYCLLRIPPKGDFLANISQGGIAKEATIPKKLSRHLAAVYSKTRAPFLCVDFLRSGDKYWFNEIETAGGFHPLPKPTRELVGKDFFDVAKKYFNR